MTHNEIGLNYGGEVELSALVGNLQDILTDEKSRGCFNIQVTLSGDEDGQVTFYLYSKRLETDADVAKRAEAARKREEKKKALAAKVKDPKYQKKLIDKMNKKVEDKMIAISKPYRFPLR